jgi:2-C-methyl-D-erythritol 2,4-cyclodiphosphate synthase
VFRVGIGYDVHRIDPGRRLILGGVEIPDHPGLDGHSDADVLLHAVADAILGARGVGDIGVHFPPSDERWRDVASEHLVRESIRIAGPGWSVANVDVTVVAESPRIGPYREQMRQRLAAALGVSLDRVSIKATTNERLGFIGRGEGIAAFATVLLEFDERAEEGRRRAGSGPASE